MLLDLLNAARYNAWANKRLHAACAELDREALWLDRKAFFKSIMGTLNHTLLADVLYRQRLEKKPVTFKKLNEILHQDFEPLRQHQQENDAWYISYCDDLSDDALDGTLSFDTVETGEYFSLPLRRCLTNLFQHQIHHRGHVHHMLSHAGIDPPPVDFIKYASGE